MGEFLAGSESGFVELMNNRAKELGMKDTTFKNTNGLDADGHLTSAHDIAIMSRELISHKKIFDYTTLWMDSIRNGDYELANTNKLIRFYEGANGLKTGSTSKAFYCLSGTAMRNGMQLIAVVMAAPTSNDRFESTKQLLDYGFANFSVKQVIKANQPFEDVEVSKGKANLLKLIAEKPFSALTSKNSKDEITTKVAINEQIVAPIKKGDIMGSVDILSGKTKLGSINIVAEMGIEREDFQGIMQKIFNIWIGNLK